MKKERNEICTDKKHRQIFGTMKAGALIKMIIFKHNIFYFLNYAAACAEF